MLGNFILSTLEGVKVSDDINDKIKDTINSYPKEVIESNIVSIFNSFNNKRIEELEMTIKKFADNNKEKVEE